MRRWVLMTIALVSCREAALHVDVAAAPADAGDPTDSHRKVVRDPAVLWGMRFEGPDTYCVPVSAVVGMINAHRPEPWSPVVSTHVVLDLNDCHGEWWNRDDNRGAPTYDEHAGGFVLPDGGAYDWRKAAARAKAAHE